MAEEMTKLPSEISKNLACLFFDTMGIFWTMKFPNKKQEKLLKEWGLKPESLNINLYVPKGLYEDYKEKDIPADYSFTIRTSELSVEDWCNLFNIKITDEMGVLIEMSVGELKEKGENYSIDDIIELIRKQRKTEQRIKDAVENRFLAAERWGLFDVEGSEIKELVKGGEVSVLDLSAYEEWNIKSLVVSLISKKLLSERAILRKAKEVTAIRSEESFTEGEGEGLPLVWLFIDEGHQFLPRIGKTPATDALIMLLREGRQPGISLVMATQQPGEIHRDVITQSDIILSHRVTSKIDIDALNSMMQSYLISDIQGYLNDLPRLSGSAIILDDNSERIYPLRVHPKRSWHGGEAPTALRLKKEIKF